MKEIIFLFALGGAALAQTAEDLRIGPAWSFPNFQKTPVITTSSAGSHLHPVFDMGDLNRDGRFDVVIFEHDGADSGALPLKSLATVYLQNVDRTFSRGAESILPVENVARDFLLADINEDGKLDLLLNDYSNDLILLLGKGDGTFVSATKLGLNAVAFPALADLNRDGHYDIVAATKEGKAMVFFGAGDGTFEPGPTLDTTTNSFGERRGQIMIGDINNDGKMDIAVASVLDFRTTWTGSLDVFLGGGDGTFQNSVRTANVGTWRGVLADFNGDGILDFAGDRYAPEGVEIWIGKPDGHFTKRITYSLAGFWPQFVTAGDLNGDAICDIVVSNTKFSNGAETPGSMAIFLGKGDGTFQTRRLLDPEDGKGSTAFAPKLIDMRNLPPIIGPFDVLQYQNKTLDIVSVGSRRDWLINSLVIASNVGSTKDPSAGFQLVGVQSPGEQVVLEYSVDLSSWTALWTNVPTGIGWTFVDSPPALVKKFYRTRKP